MYLKIHWEFYIPVSQCQRELMLMKHLPVSHQVFATETHLMSFRGFGCDF